MKVIQTEFKDLTFLYYKMKKLVYFENLGVHSTCAFSGPMGYQRYRQNLRGAGMPLLIYRGAILYIICSKIK